MRWVLKSSMQLRLLVVIAAGIVLSVGVRQLRDMPVDVLPEFSQPYVEIQTEALGLSAEEVEQMITVGLEQDLLNGLPWLETIRSESVQGMSSIVLLFERGTDLMRARQMVSERLTQAYAMPHVSKPPVMLQPLSATSRVMMVGLSSKNLSLIQMGVLARWTIAPRLMGVPGVANVAIWGQRDWQLQVQVDPKRLQDQSIPLQQVLETTGNALWVSSLSYVEASTPGTGGFIDTANQRLGIRHILPIVSPEGLSEVPIEDSSLRLGDVANVVEDHQPLIGDAITKDGPGLLLVVEKFPSANTLEVTHGVEDALAELLPGLPGIDVDSTIFRPADFIETATHNLGIAAIAGLALVLLILVAFYLAWRSTVISLVTIPLSLIAACLVLYATGATFNMIVLTGFVMAIGVVTYDSILDVEHIVRRLRQHRNERSSKSTVRVILDACCESRGAIIYAVPIALVAVSPIFFIDGASGPFFRPLAVSYGLAILASMAVTFTVTPALCLLLMARTPVRRSQPALARGLQGIYEAVLSLVIRHGRLAFIAACLCIAGGATLLPKLSRSLVPSFKELSLLIHLRAAPGTSQPEMNRISGRMSQELRAIEGVRNVGTHIGRAIRGDQVVDVNSAEVWVSIEPSAQYEKTTHAIQDVVEGYPGLAFQVQTYLREKSGDVVAEPEDNIVIRVYGDKHDVLGEKAKDVQEAIAGINGIAHTTIKRPVQQATLETKVDLAAAQRHGIKPGDVRRAATTLVSGVVVGSLYEDQKVFDVVVWSTPETRHSLSDIRDLTIDTPNGEHVRLGEVADVRIVPSASVIRHEACKRYIDVVVEVQGRDLAAVAGDINQRIQQVQFPLENYARVLGEYAAPRAARMRLAIVTAAAAIGVLFLLQAAFRSWGLAVLCFITMPSALVGGLVAAYYTGAVVSLGSFAGLLAVFAIAICTSVTLIRHCQHLTSGSGMDQIDPEVVQFRAQFDTRNRLDTIDGPAGFGPGTVQRAARQQFVPILMMTLATAVSLAPLLYLGDLPGFEIVRPMAIVILGGLVTATLYTLFIVPAMFLMLGPSQGLDLDDLRTTWTDEELRDAMSRLSKETVKSELSN